MAKISGFIKEHIPLCVCTFGVAILGYLGYRLVHRIINKCQKTEKIDQVVKEQLSSKHSSIQTQSSLKNRVDKLEKITMGQGEYIVFHKLRNGKKQPVSPKTFEKVYKILNQYSPAAIINSGSEDANEKCANRYELIKAELKKIDPTLEAVFIPKTLYELFFIRKCIREDLKHHEICPLLNRAYHKMGNEGKQQEIEAIRKCWHINYLTNKGDNIKDNQNTGVKAVAYRLNQTIFKVLDPSSEGFTLQVLSSFTEDKIDFLKKHYNDCLMAKAKQDRGEDIEYIFDPKTPGPTTNFGAESQYGSIRPMGICNDQDAQIIRNAVALDCSQIAKHSFLLFRGADFQEDSVFDEKDKTVPYSLSFGSSLFAGCLYDGGATPFHYMRHKKKSGYVIAVSFDKLNDSPFFIPTTNTVAQLSGEGEIFHARTKAWKGFDLQKMQGLGGTNSHIRDHLKSNFSREELDMSFREYKDKAIQLKSAQIV